METSKYEKRRGRVKKQVENFKNGGLASTLEEISIDSKRRRIFYNFPFYFSFSFFIHRFSWNERSLFTKQVNVIFGMNNKLKYHQGT